MAKNYGDAFEYLVWNIRNFQQITRYISKTVQDRRIVVKGG